ncbi:hypothetical protein [Burkholderia diffusa]|uniref:hypothetical protein n=1 Tax=Burkholderia diffusa TaxID=488732 RepID=UPI00158A4BC2|nr:hypothetical protein [Burkholderia diffusa]
MTLRDRVLAHAAATKRLLKAREATPIRYAGPLGVECVQRNVRVLDYDVDTLLFISPYFDPESGRSIGSLAEIDAAPTT